MNITRLSAKDDFPGWLELAREVEPLFGPMVADPIFQESLKVAIAHKMAFCTADENGFYGGIVISPENNEILWLAVTQKCRGRGFGTALLTEALSHLDQTKPISVTTFDQTCPAGIPARKLYLSFGFQDDSPAGLNPAGIPIVTMICPCNRSLI